LIRKPELAIRSKSPPLAVEKHMEGLSIGSREVVVSEELE
jgi:hypothetical protein